MSQKPVMLCILDGWGYAAPGSYNAITLANTPCWDRLWETMPHGFLKTSGLDVGLPEGQMGNSEVGHMNIGAGRVVFQDLPRIDKALAEGAMRDNPIFQDLIATLKTSGGACHLLGLVSPGGVHAHQDHLAQIARMIAGENIPVKIHVVTDGRDTPPQSGLDFIQKLEKDVAHDLIEIVTLSGRYYMMDRDKRWERVELAYRAMIEGVGPIMKTPSDVIQSSYQEGVFDEFIKPHTKENYEGIKANDALFCVNFRADRVRQILTAVVDPDFSEFARPHFTPLAKIIGMTEYADFLNPFLQTMFPPQKIENGLGETVAKAGLRQLRAAETEKYPHVTFFFNGGREDSFEGEARVLAPSPKVATYDLQPEMSAGELTDKVIAHIEAENPDFIAINFANPDMVGHTGSIPAAIKAVETVDQCLARLVDVMTKRGGAMVVTADHGNAEQMFDDATGQPHTAHTLNVVPVVIVNASEKIEKVKEGRLADLAPTVLKLLGIKQPEAMTGAALF